MSCERNIRFELLARLCPNATGADIRSVCTEAGNNLFFYSCFFYSILIYYFYFFIFSFKLNNNNKQQHFLFQFKGMYAVRARRKIVEEKDFLSAVNKVIKEHAKFSATPKYLIHN